MPVLLRPALLAAAMPACAAAAPAWFVDGYHGGVYGHYPAGYTGFLVEQLQKHPDWKINLEIEPETWDVARVQEPRAYAEFKKLMADQSDSARIEMVNPTYAQSYFFQSSGESVIRQFDHGIRKLRGHFPDARLTTYSSEEPCFTSCLPPILKSFGYQFAVLKNPNTCWGGYTTAHGGELVNWIGPDGTSITTVPRYQCEALHPRDPWQTIASGNSPEYISACFEQGIAHPVGMCLQDAGWGGGPWLRWSAKNHHQPSRYVTWSDYIANVAGGKSTDDWHFTQEDVRPGLMWGAQVLQQIARRSRSAENGLLVAEKLAAMAWLRAGRPAATASFDEAWHHVLLSQHHDCWIVPYNGRFGNTWADQVRRWTDVAQAISTHSQNRSLDGLLETRGRASGRFVRIFNPTASELDAVVAVPVPAGGGRGPAIARDAAGGRSAVQRVESGGGAHLLVRATVPPLGATAVELVDGEAPAATVTATAAADGMVVMESDLHRILIDPAAGGTLRSVVAKALGGREFVDSGADRRFNELRGHFHELGGFRSSADQAATVTVTESGPLRATVEVAGEIAGHPFLQRISLSAGSPVIDCSVRIDWRGNPRIGEHEEKDGWKNMRRAAYDDRFKLLALFPAALGDIRVSKSAPFDVCESRLEDTFYQSWDNLKHNVILDWVDFAAGDGSHGLAVFSDHTTSYTQGADHPPGLTLQYSGKGLWGRDYRIDGPTEVRYALVPHAGKWDAAGLPALAAAWQQPPLGVLARTAGAGGPLLDVGKSGWEVPAMFERDGALFVRLFNAAGDESEQRVRLGFSAESVELVELDGRVIRTLQRDGEGALRLAMPRFGIRTLRFRGIAPPELHR